MNSALPQEELSVEQALAHEAIVDPVLIQPRNPLQTIALAFSGGGFRAASFSLGALSYLARIQFKGQPLLENVKFITSTSGGSIANGAYTVHLYLRPEEKFSDFYKRLRDDLDGEKLLKEVFRILGAEKEWVEQGTLKCLEGKPITVHKQRNLINAFAKSYDSILFNNATLGTITGNSSSGSKLPHLEEVCFNATELNNGLNFYFKVNGKNGYVRKYGNSYLQFQDFDAARKLKISDIVAASACFPGGFEPIVFPNDFVHPGATDVNELIGAIKYSHNKPSQIDKVKDKPFSLVDGGVTDNMGLNAVLVEDNMRRKYQQESFDLILACDVTSYFVDPVEKAATPKNWLVRNLKLNHIRYFFLLFNLVFILAVASLALHVFKTAGLLLLIPSFALSFLYWTGKFLLCSGKKHSSSIRATVLKNLGFFGKLPLSAVVPMISARVNTVVMLMSDLFLKQIRRDQYNYMFSFPSLRARAIGCFVYEFSTANAERRLKNLKERDNE